mmetsp:Transcript_4449/g.5073  ORF Transcript_4449/g.5073 Transcript_4449/m.5073 type:complete len:544 (-) Transcript_4449:160-1791(-)
MASLEQLQILEDDETTTSSSSNNSNTSSRSSSSSSENEEDDGPISATTNTDYIGYKEVAYITDYTLTAHHKKRLKLSLGGSFKNLLSGSHKIEHKDTGDGPDANGDACTVATKTTNSKNDNNSNESLVVNADTVISTTSPKEKDLNSSSQIISHNNHQPSSSPQKEGNRPISSGIKEKPSSKTEEKPKILLATKISSHTKKRKSIPIRLSPMSSPGLLLAGNNFRGSGSTNFKSNDLISPNAVFIKTTRTAGYNTENRTKNPHRGSSTQLNVDDLFDSNVKFCQRFPKLVPEDLVTYISSSSLASKSKQKKSTMMLTLPERLIKAFQRPSSPSANSNTAKFSYKKHGKRIPQYSDMIPLSLTLPYPGQYIEKRLEYIKKINIREKIIVILQKEQEAFECTQEKRENAKNNVQDVPPIPVVPDSPRLSELKDIPCIEETFGSEEQYQQDHPLYLPKNKMLVNHLDKRCFHIVSGRYFGLLSNCIADPHFFGPSAPGIGNLSSSSGLATATFGGPLLMAPAQSSSTVPVNKNSKSIKSSSLPIIP